ncbi:Histidine kinase osmosensor [Rhizina undulata]
MRIRIREQLSLLVALTALTAVGTLAIVTWFNNYQLVLEARSSRFSLTASLKSAQVAQGVALLHNTVYAISTRPTLQNALQRYRTHGNNTAANWNTTLQDLMTAASSSSGGFVDVLQLVVYDDQLSNGGPGVENGTIIDGVVVGGDGYTGYLANGTRLNVGSGLGGRLGLLNITGDNAIGIILPGSVANGGVGGPMKIDIPVNDTDEYYAEEQYNLTHGIPFNDGFPNALYPVSLSEKYIMPEDVNTALDPELISRRNGLLLGPMAINETYFIMSFTIPVINNTSTTDVLGFVTVVVNANLILEIIQDTRGLGYSGQTALVGSAAATNMWNYSEVASEITNGPALENQAGGNDLERRFYGLHGKVDHSLSLRKIAEKLWKRSWASTDAYINPKAENNTNDLLFRYLLPPGRNRGLVGQTRTLGSYPVLERVFTEGIDSEDGGDGGGSNLNTHNSEGRLVSVGYALPNITLAQWALLIEQDKSEAFQPIERLRNILLATVFGTFAVVITLVCPIAHFAVRPISRLKTATEKSTRPPSYTPDGSRSASSLIDGIAVSSDDEGDGARSEDAAEKGRNGLSAIRNFFTRRNKQFPEEDNNYGAGSRDERRRRAFRIPGKVPERSHVIHDELTDLTRTFNEMSDELMRQYENLEERVAERTQELEEQKKLAEAANQAKSLFVANITHELRTPLNGILGMCAVCMQEDDIPKIKQSLGIVYKSGELLLHLLTDLLTFSKNQIGHMAISLDEKEFKMMDISTQVIAIFEQQAKENKIDLTISMLPDKLKEMVFWGDANRILQVLINLVSNALKFTPENGAVHVRINILHEIESREAHKVKRRSSRTGSRHDSNRKPRSKGLPSLDSSNSSSSTPQNQATPGYSTTSQSPPPISRQTLCETDKLQTQVFNGELPRTQPAILKTYMIEFQVQDTGPGIPENIHEKIFEPFVQGDLTLSKKFGGTGLGLSICLQLATLMKGKIDLKSAEEAGATFSMKIPLKLVTEKASSLTSKEPMSRRNSVSRNGSMERGALDKGISDKGTADNAPQNSNKSVNGGFGKNNKPRLLGLSQPFFAPNLPSNYEISKDTGESSKGGAGGEESNGIRVLVAEDNQVNQEVVLKLLKLEKISDVTLAKDGQEAVDAIKEALSQGRRFHLVLMDIQMPNLDGLESTRMIRDLGYSAPIVALTAFAEESNVKDCLDAGMDYFLAKPIKRTQLKAVLKTYCTTIKEGEEAYSSRSTTAGASNTTSPANSPLKTETPSNTPITAVGDVKMSFASEDV